MTNYLDVAQLTKPECIDEAREIFISMGNKSPKNFSQYRKQISDLNSFLYTYFLIKYNKDLHYIAGEFNDSLDEAKDIKALDELGELIITAYSDTLLEKINYSENDIVNSAVKIINRDYSGGVALDDIAKELHISKNYLCSLFKKYTGVSFCKYINTLKTNMAKKLLAENKKSLEYISYECGFSSQAHFTLTFKKYTGLTPGEYRKKIYRLNQQV